MNRMNGLMRTTARVMALLMLLVSMPLGLAQAGMVSTDQVIDQVTIAETREQVIEFLARDDVRQQMEALGIDGDEATARAANMTDQEVMRLAGHLDQLPAGQDALGAILGAFLVVFLILLLTDILGLTSVFPFTR